MSVAKEQLWAYKPKDVSNSLKLGSFTVVEQHCCQVLCLARVCDQRKSTNCANALESSAILDSPPIQRIWRVALDSAQGSIVPRKPQCLQLIWSPNYPCLAVIVLPQFVFTVTKPCSGITSKGM